MLRRFWFVGGAILLVLVVAVTFFAAFLLGEDAPERAPVSVSGSESEDFPLSFGLSRLPITRTVLLNLCPEGAADQAFPECSEQTNGAGAGATARPDVTSAGVVADLRRPDGEAQFPANQLAVVAANEGSQGLRITVTADPRQPERVGAGTYEGTLVVERSPGPAAHFDMTTVIKARKGWTSTEAFAFLLGGALAGALVKWLNDVFAPLATLRRRHRRLARVLRPDTPYLPLTVTRSLGDVRASIRGVDADGVAARIDLIGQHREELTEFAAALSALYRELDIQAALTVSKNDQNLETYLRRQEDKLQALRAQPWPWQKPEGIRQKLLELQREFEDATDRFLEASTPGGEDVTAVAADLADRGVDRADVRAAAEEHAAARRKTRDREAEESRRNAFEVILDNSWWIILLVSAFAITGLGYKTQYLDDDGYRGDATDLMKLAAWAFALQLAGTTVAEATGRLLTHGRSTSTTG